MSRCYEVANPFRKWRRAKHFMLGKWKCKYGDKVLPLLPGSRGRLFPALCSLHICTRHQDFPKTSQKVSSFLPQKLPGAGGFGTLSPPLLWGARGKRCLENREGPLFNVPVLVSSCHPSSQPCPQPQLSPVSPSG